MFSNKRVIFSFVRAAAAQSTQLAWIGFPIYLSTNVCPSMIWKYNFSYDGNTLNMSHISNKRFSQIDMIKMIEIILIMTVLHTKSLHMSFG